MDIQAIFHKFKHSFTVSLSVRMWVCVAMTSGPRTAMSTDKLLSSLPFRAIYYYVRSFYSFSFAPSVSFQFNFLLFFVWRFSFCPENIPFSFFSFTSVPFVPHQFSFFRQKSDNGLLASDQSPPKAPLMGGSSSTMNKI